ncbi:carbohydrate kinase [Ornithinimicrobium sp. F0845]|uniref:carbohydrate kinase family protein n=1 Tax=Ornithinimicrobium sp. F0845 TaxID=2926412 RepID=UPI001FF4782A|nr:carbohydrate kinase [Ornithinimicrobium sp. F0845]MCK0111005.1 carbohydrate kinase [Ornithinimicrobium sp. F0845]
MPPTTGRAGRTLVIGEALIDIVGGAEGQREYVGGSPANVAMGLARLGHPVDFLTHLGPDARGTRVAEHLTAAGLRLVPGAVAPRTSTATARLDAEGGATYDFDLAWDIPAVDLAGTAHVHTGSIAATLEPGASRVLETLQRARAATTVSYDPNLRPSIMGEPHDVRARVEELIGRADAVKASDEDIGWLYAGATVEQVAHLWGRLGPAVVVVTRGSEGALLHLPATGDQHLLTAAPAQVVDTVGAGDSFMAGLLSGLLDAGYLGDPGARGRLRTAGLRDILPAVERAAACAHWTIERAGAAAPTRSDLSA